MSVDVWSSLLLVLVSSFVLIGLRRRVQRLTAPSWRCSVDYSIRHVLIKLRPYDWQLHERRPRVQRAGSVRHPHTKEHTTR